MKIASITEAKNRLSALLDKVRHGESVLITDRDRPVARLEPVGSEDQADANGRLAHLERKGIIRRGTGKPAKAVLEKSPPKAIQGASVLRALLDERNEGR